jgi:hypothetical protein
VGASRRHGSGRDRSLNYCQASIRNHELKVDNAATDTTIFTRCWHLELNGYAQRVGVWNASPKTHTRRMALGTHSWTEHGLLFTADCLHLGRWHGRGLSQPRTRRRQVARCSQWRGHLCLQLSELSFIDKHDGCRMLCVGSVPIAL